jgi:Flp pilus assembly protein TadG
MMFFGLVEFGEAFAVNRKLTNAASTVSDLIAQVPEVSTAGLDDVARVADEIIKPYATTPMSMIVSSVETDGDGNVTVGWSYAHGGGATARQPGNSYTLPQGLAEPNSSVIVTETFYQFTPGVGLFLTGTITLSGQAFFRPRLSSAVVFND